MNEGRDYHYQTKRYVGVRKAALRLCGNKITDRKLSVNQLHIHLEGKQNLYFDPKHNGWFAEENTGRE